MTNSFKASEQTIKLIKTYYEDCKVENNNPYISFFAKNDSYSVSIYSTGTVMFSGIDYQKDLEMFYKEDKIEFINHAGSDEVGCGDFFGPIVVAATIVKDIDVDDLISLGIKDSKQLNDERIKKIAPKLLKMIPSSTFVLSNEKYNEIYKDHNLNSIKAYLHNFVLTKLTIKEKFNGLVVIDQFCEEDLYYKYLNSYGRIDTLRGIFFTTKAENKYLAVACASIIARYTFLKEMEKINKAIGKNVPFGAGSIVDEFASTLVKEKGFDFIKPYIKLNYKNVNKITKEEEK